ncbi:RloB-like protein [Murinocardiopsis flavida]|uniref:RloB-like protein n=1 Tax=Murinocardiopsis flavida TaxID=645275 RepID=A0A2P8DES8_9ACTN|nr:RloB family protein [Murinocardiopsis flavida]PSK95725.1 RloB-like protein [Murinocardiopsis flavida]
MNRPKRLKKSLRRSSLVRESKERILVVCEGEVTEVQYLNGLKQLFSALPVDVVPVGKGGTPEQVVDLALAKQAEAEDRAERANDGNLNFDQTWCLVDVDEHVRIPEALARARRAGVKAVVSNPCFELWLLYHYQDLQSTLHRAVLCEKLRNYIRGYDKHLPLDFPYDRHDLAKKRALRAAADHTATCSRGNNPSTNAWLLVEAIQRAGKTKER